ncbi:hypothetical protein P171DRAFT_356690 [Karstenula rhodostoma CBS 690.94]|uniref:Transmembrane protein n=1 Tax=Karstenula rhodostoma CBS 690.94 TaxID=1392251 RepID=A0A9P4PNR2_9PLEO|nr:hypothetical protein P171DRAFT_356690 [Karstenula rhodostoma CBS 690.94]
MAPDPSTTRVMRSIRGRYRVQAFLILGHHFFLQSPLLLDMFVVLFILVSNFMNRQNTVPSQLFVQGMRLLGSQRRELLC